MGEHALAPAPRNSYITYIRVFFRVGSVDDSIQETSAAGTSGGAAAFRFLDSLESLANLKTDRVGR